MTRIEKLEKALSLALSELERFEPPDSRAVSDEFVSMASVLADCDNEKALEIIENGLNRPLGERIYNEVIIEVL